MIKVIARAETGIQWLALHLAKELGVTTSGMLPKGCLTEKGNQPELIKEFDLLESKSPAYKVANE